MEARERRRDIEVKNKLPMISNGNSTRVMPGYDEYDNSNLYNDPRGNSMSPSIEGLMAYTDMSSS